MILIMSLPLSLGYCLILKNQECKVRKLIIDNDYMTFPYKISINRCIGSCNDKNNPYLKTCLPNSIKNISIKSLDLLSNKYIFKNTSFHQNCKSDCLLDENVCNNLQKFNTNKCRCECLIVKKCKNGFWNVNNCRCENKKFAKLISTEECDTETDKINNKAKIIFRNNTLTKKIENCKPFIGISILFLLVSLTFGGIIIYLLKSKNNNFNQF